MASSDPGPVLFKDADLRPESPEPDVGSQSTATENSDDEPLEGDNTDHIAQLLAKVLEPDERSTAENAGEEESDEDDVVSEEAEFAAALSGQGAADVDPFAGVAIAETSDAEDLEESTALKIHLFTLRQGIQNFDAWAQTCMSEAEADRSPASFSVDSVPPRPAATAAAAAAAAAAATAATASTAAATPQKLAREVRALRELQSQLRALVFNQQALCAYYTQHLLRVAHAQAEIAMRRHKECQRRHKQLRIVRRESARLCRALEIEQQSRASSNTASYGSATSSDCSAPTAARSASAIDATRAPWFAPSAPPIASTWPGGGGGAAGDAPSNAHGPIEDAAAEEGPTRGTGGTGRSRRAAASFAKGSGNGRPAAAARRPATARKRAAGKKAEESTFRTLLRAMCNGSGGDEADDETGAAVGNGVDGEANAVGIDSVVELARLVHLACDRASSRLGPIGLPVPPPAETRAHTSVRLSGRHFYREGVAAPAGATSSLLSAYANPPSVARRSKSPEGGAARTAATEAARQTLRHPAVQAAIAESMWELLAER